MRIIIITPVSSIRVININNFATTVVFSITRMFCAEVCHSLVHYIIWRFSAQEDFAGADRKSAGRPSPPGLDAKARGLKPPGRYQVWFPSRRSFRRSSGPSGMRTAPLAASSSRERYPQGAAAGSIPTARAKTMSVPLSPT